MPHSLTNGRWIIQSPCQITRTRITSWTRPASSKHANLTPQPGGALGFLTQADLLQFIGPALTARSDTFRIRAYGECLDAAGKVMAKAWCETVVQRSPGYVDGTDTSLALPATLSATNRRFGRRFEIIAFRWLRPEEI